MALDPAGPYGLWRRLSVWVYHTNQEAALATILHIPLASLHAYLDDPANGLAPAELASVDAHLAEVPKVDWKVTDGEKFAVYRTMKPRWTQADIDALVPPVGAEASVMTGYEPSYTDELESEGPNDLDTFDIGEQVAAAYGDELDLLTDVTWYVPND